MSLYRRWRPKSFNDLVGQDAVVRTLRTALTSGRLAHAYLFSGPRGSGKTSAAKILARCVDCVNGPTPDPDNTCDNCLAILAGSALDVLEIDAASNRGIGEIRELREAVKFAPAQMRMKVYILDEAHAITPDGANAFLKTLEEPPPHAIFILATTAPERLPQTILSRCQRYAFKRIDIATMIARMRTIADAEGIEIDDPALAAIAYRADGGLRDALTMLEQVAAFAGEEKVNVAAIEDAFGATGRKYARDLVRAVLANDAAAALRIVDQASDAGADMQELLRSIVAEERNLLVAQLDPELLARDLSAEDGHAVRETAAAAPQELLVNGLRLLNEALAAARFSPNPRLDVETVVMRLVLSAGASRPAADPRPASAPASAPPVPIPTHTAPATSRAVKAKPAPVSQSPAPESAQAPAGAGTPGETPTLQRVRALWQNIRTRAEGERTPLKVPLSRATVDSVEGDVLTIRLVDSTTESYVREHAPIIERAIAEVLGVPLRLNVKAERISSQARSGHRAAPRDSEPDAGSDSDPIGLLDYASKTITPRTRS